VFLPYSDETYAKTQAWIHERGIFDTPDSTEAAALPMQWRAGRRRFHRRAVFATSPLQAMRRISQILGPLELKRPWI